MFLYSLEMIKITKILTRNSVVMFDSLGFVHSLDCTSWQGETVCLEDPQATHLLPADIILKEASLA